MSLEAVNAEIFLDELSAVARELEESNFDLDRAMTRKDVNQAIAAALISLRVRICEEHADLMKFEAQSIERRSNQFRNS